MAYAASFGDSHFTEDDLRALDKRIKNFKAMGIREGGRDLNYLKAHAEIPVKQVIDPTLFC